MNIKNTVLCYVLPCSLVDRYKNFKRTHMPPLSEWKMENLHVAGSSKTLVDYFYFPFAYFFGHHNSEDCNLLCVVTGEY